MNSDREGRKEVRNLILMLSSSVIFAFAVVLGLIYYFGASGTYLLSDVLVAPDALERISFEDYNPKTGKRARFVYNTIEFTKVDMSGKGWGRFAVSPAQYAAFYKTVDDERSVPQLSDEIIKQFALVAPSTLTIYVGASDNTGNRGEGRIFQRVEFLDGDAVFRVQKRAAREGGKEEWIYFRSPEIYERVTRLFAPEASR